MTRSNLCLLAAFFGLSAASWVHAAPVEQRADRSIPADQFGDRQAGNFGDMGQGHFGNSAEGYFLTRNFRRDQEGTLPAVPGVPKRFRPVPSPPPPKATAPAQVTPYVVITPKDTADTQKNAVRRNSPTR